MRKYCLNLCSSYTIRGHAVHINEKDNNIHLYPTRGLFHYQKMYIF